MYLHSSKKIFIIDFKHFNIYYACYTYTVLHVFLFELLHLHSSGIVTYYTYTVLVWSLTTLIQF